MQDLKLAVTSRKSGKAGALDADSASVRGVVYGREVGSTPIQANFQELDHLFNEAGMNQLIQLEVDGKDTHDVLFKEIQRNPVTNEIQHFDMYAVKRGEKLQAEVPISFVGDSPAVLRGGTLSTLVESVQVECIPSKLPDGFELDVSTLEEIGDALHISDIKVDPDVEILADPEQTVVKAEEIKELEVEDTSVVEEEIEGEEGEDVEGEEGGEDESSDSESEEDKESSE